MSLNEVKSTDQLGEDTIFTMLSEVTVAEFHCWSHNFLFACQGGLLFKFPYISLFQKRVLISNKNLSISLYLDQW